MPQSLVRVAADGVGKAFRTLQRTVGGQAVEEQYVLVGDPRDVTFRGRASSFRITGRAPATPFVQNILTVYNAAGSTVLVDVNRIVVDIYQTAPKLIGVHPPIVRVGRFTTALTGGTVLTKTALDTAETSNVAVTVTNDASADGTNSATPLGVTLTANAVLTQEVAPRVVTPLATTTASVNPFMEPADRMEFFVGPGDVTLRAGQGACLYLVGQAATSIPVTDFIVASVDWEEYTLP